MRIIISILICTLLSVTVLAFNSRALKMSMDYVNLGSSELKVSKVCLGTMTWGEQNTEAEGIAQLDTAFGNYGINFLVNHSHTFLNEFITAS